MYEFHEIEVGNVLLRPIGILEDGIHDDSVSDH